MTGTNTASMSVKGSLSFPDTLARILPPWNPLPPQPAMEDRERSDTTLWSALPHQRAVSRHSGGKLFVCLFKRSPRQGNIVHLYTIGRYNERLLQHSVPCVAWTLFMSWRIFATSELLVGRWSWCTSVALLTWTLFLVFLLDQRSLAARNGFLKKPHHIANFWITFSCTHFHFPTPRWEAFSLLTQNKRWICQRLPRPLMQWMWLQKPSLCTRSQTEIA